MKQYAAAQICVLRLEMGVHDVKLGVEVVLARL